MALGQSSVDLIAGLSAREAVLLGEIFRIEDDLQAVICLDSECEREACELLIDQLQLLMNRLSTEDELIWAHLNRVAAWLRDETVARAQEQDYSLASLVAKAEANKGAPLTEEEYLSLKELADEIAECNRLLADQL